MQEKLEKEYSFKKYFNTIATSFSSGFCYTMTLVITPLFLSKPKRAFHVLSSEYYQDKIWIKCVF